MAHSDQQTSARHSPVIRLWHSLTMPSDAVQSTEARQHARMLATLLLVLIPAGVAGGLIMPLLQEGGELLPTTDFLVPLVVLSLLVTYYALSRTVYHRLAARLTVLTISAGVFILAIPHNDPTNIQFQVYLVAPVLFSSLLLTPAETITLIAAHLVGMLAFPLLFENTTIGNSWTIYVLTISMLLFAALYYITERERNRQDRLQQHIDRTQAILAAFPDLIFRMDANGMFLDYEANETTPLLEPPGIFIGQTLDDVMPRDTAEASMARIRKTLETGTVQTTEYALSTSDGHRWFEARSVPYGLDEVLTVVRDVTDRHKAMEALRQSQERYQALIDAIPDLMFRLDRNGTFLDYKSAAMGLVAPVEMFLGKSVREVLPQIADQTLDAIARALQTGAVQQFEYQLPFEDEIHTYEARISAGIRDEVFAIVRDVTDQRQHQITLRESEARFRTLFEDSPISLWEEDFSAVLSYLKGLHARGVSDLATYFRERPDEVYHCAKLVRILNVNQATLESVGVEIKDSLYNTLEAILDEEWHLQFRRELVTFFRGSTRYESETSHRRPDGERASLLLTAVIAPGYEATWERVYVSVVDITERKRTEEALATSERQLELVLDGAELGLWDWDLPTNRLIMNKWWARILGLQLEDLEPHLSTWDSRLHPDDRARVWRAHHAHLDGLTPNYVCEYRLRAHNGDWVWVLDRGKVVERDANGAPCRMAGTYMDITSRKQAEEAERQQRALAEALRDVIAVLTSSLDLDHVLDQILTTLGRVVPHDASTITLLENGIVRIVRSQGYPGDPAEQHPQAIEDLPLLRHMLNARQPILITDTLTDARWVTSDATAQMRSFVGAPISWNDHVVGFIGVQSKAPQFFNHTHTERLRAFADQAAIALRNAQWYETAQRRLNEMEALHRSMLNITSQLTLDDLLNSLIQNALKLLDADAGGIYLYLPDEDVLEWAVSAGMDVIPIGARLKRGEGLSGKVWEYNRSMIIDNYNTWEHHIKALAGLPFQAVIAVPIHWRGQLLGVINAAVNTERRKFKDHERWLLELFANQAAIAIQNARLFDAEFQQRALAEALRNTAAAINSTLDLDEILERLLVAIRPVAAYDAANILMIDGDRVHVARQRGYEQYGTAEWMQEFTIAIAEWPMFESMMEQHKGFIVSDTHIDSDWRYSKETEWMRAQLAVPIRVEGRVIGSLNLDSATPGRYTQLDLEHVQAFADQAGLAINNAWLYAEARQRRDDLEKRVLERTLDLSVRNAVAETLSSSLDIEEMLTGVLNVVTGQLDVQSGAIYLAEPNHDQLTLVTTYGAAAATLAPALSLHDGLEDPPATISERPTMLRVPIWRQEQVEGMIVLQHEHGRVWSESETRMLDAIGRQIGVALANARSYASAVQGAARIRTILHSVTDGLMVFDKDDKLLLLNPAAEELFNFYALGDGGTQQAATRLWDWLRDYQARHPEQHRIELPLPQAALSIDGSWAAFTATCGVSHCPATPIRRMLWPCWLKADGIGLDDVSHCAFHQQARMLAVQVQSAAVRNDAGDLLGTLIVLNDVTHYRELDELKGRFVSTVSHELRTPLSAMLLQIGTLLKYYERFEETERKAMIEEIQEQSQVLRDLIEDILELSRFDANRLIPQKQWFDIVTTCRDVLDAMSPAIEDKALHLDTTRCTGSRYVMGDPNQLQRVLRNLLSNAIKYTPPEGTISVSLRQQGTEIALAVTDTGIGISPEEQDYVFERFYRTRDAIDMASGTGLGLSITQEIVHLHGGRIELHSSPGRGSTFTLILPTGEFNLLGRR